MSSSESELSDSDVELQKAFASGELKPGLNVPEKVQRQLVNNISAIKQKLEEFKYKLPWIEVLDSVNKEAPLAPELAAELLIQQEKRENQLKNNKKLPQFDPRNDPILNDFKREMMFHRQAQAAVLETFPRLQALGLPTKRPDDYFAEMAKTDEHMQKIRTNLMKKQMAQERSERVKQLRTQRKEGKMLQIQAKLERQKEKKQMLEQVKKVRKGQGKNLDFLDGKNKKSMERRKGRDKKFGFGGKKRGSKLNTKESAADITEYRNPGKPGNKRGGSNKRLGKSRRMKSKNKGRK